MSNNAPWLSSKLWFEMFIREMELNPLVGEAVLFELIATKHSRSFEVVAEKFGNFKNQLTALEDTGVAVKNVHGYICSLSVGKLQWDLSFGTKIWLNDELIFAN